MSFRIAFVMLALASCSTPAQHNTSYQKVSVEQLHDQPEDWDGKRVEVSGWVVRQLFGTRLSRSLDGICNDLKPIVVGLGVTDPSLPSPYTRHGTFRGIFRSNGKMGSVTPGRLVDVRLVSWLGQPVSACF